MSADLDLFCRAMDGLWEVVSVEPEGKKFRVTYRSLDVAWLTWSHTPYHPELVNPVGVRGRIGFMGLGTAPGDESEL